MVDITVDGTLLRRLVETLHGPWSEVVLQVGTGGLVLASLDRNGAMLCRLQRPRGCFEAFECSADETLTVRVEALAKALGAVVRPDTPVTLRGEPRSPDALFVRARARGGADEWAARVPRVANEPGQTLVSPPDDFAVFLWTESKALLDKVKYLASVGDSLELVVRSRTVVEMSAKGALCEVKHTLTLDHNKVYLDREGGATENETAVSVPSKSLHACLKACAADAVQLAWGPNRPLRVCYLLPASSHAPDSAHDARYLEDLVSKNINLNINSQELSTLTFYLAPKIND